ncbi:MAG: hypothetical protein ACXWQO_15785, partial [Bdellovibrionota bacterium]
MKLRKFALSGAAFAQRHTGDTHVIFGWKKTQPEKGGNRRRAKAESGALVFADSTPEKGLIRFEKVSLPPAIQELSLEIPLGS